MEENQQVLSLVKNILTEKGLNLEKGHKILDFGCGAGRHVYEFLDNGYKNCFGYDIANYLNVRNKKELAKFAFDKDKIPYPNDTFDVIFSMQVLEHVADYPKVLAEMARVLKPGGVALHVFPSKWRMIEPHINVPLGGIFKSRGYYNFWAKLGCKNVYQQENSTKEITEANYKYANAHLHYHSGRSLEKLFRDSFKKLEACELDLLKHSAGRGQKLLPIIRFVPGLLWLYRTCWTRVILLQN